MLRRYFLMVSPSSSLSDSSLLAAPLQPLARLGADVLGIDPVEDSIGTARLHSSFDPDLRGRLRYRACTLEELSAEAEEEGGDGEQGTGLFDAIVASEVVEHLADRETFALCCGCMLKVREAFFQLFHLAGRAHIRALGLWACSSDRALTPHMVILLFCAVSCARCASPGLMRARVFMSLHCAEPRPAAMRAAHGHKGQIISWVSGPEWVKGRKMTS